MEFFQFSILRGLGYGKKIFPMFWSLTALYFFRGSKDILKSLDFKNIKKPQIFKSKTAPKVPYTRVLYNVALLE